MPTVMIPFFIVAAMVKFTVLVSTVTATITAIVIILYEGLRDGGNIKAGQPGLDEYNMTIQWK